MVKEKHMIELHDDRLVFSFPDVHPHAKLTIHFQRTLRIPDDGRTYPLPPGLGAFPLRHVDDCHRNVPADWLRRGGVMLPMYQSEAMWIYFQAEHIAERWTKYPFAIKIATGKINAVSGKEWCDGLHRRPQDYAVCPGQPWLDGYCVEKGLIRQFVAMPLGAGYTAEEQITGKAEHGGLQILVHPMKADVFERRFPVRTSVRIRDEMVLSRSVEAPCYMSPMGLAPGGLMKQDIYEDPFELADWDMSSRGRCFVHIANSLMWQSITGTSPPSPPPTAKEYARAKLPWFDYYAENLQPLDGSEPLAKLKSVVTMGQMKGEVPLPENESVDPKHIVQYRVGLKPEQVREGAF
jgi:hypothetical protein